MFVKRTDGNHICIIMAYADELIFVSSNEESLDHEISPCIIHFEETEKPQEWYPAVHFAVQEDVFTISKSASTEKCLHQFYLERCQTFSTRVVTNFFGEVQHHTDDPIIESENYKNMIGCLQFLARHSRPDITLSVHILAQTSARPINYLSNCTKRTFGYLKLTKHYALQFDLQDQTGDTLLFHCNSNFGGDREY